MIISILQDREGHLWFGGAGLSRYDGEKWTTFTTKDGLAHDSVWGILQDREGSLWIGTQRGGVSRFDGRTFTNYTTKDGLAHNGVVKILQDREGMFWFGTYGGGVSQYDGQTLTAFTDEDGLAENSVIPMFQERAGNLWIGTYMSGISRYDGQTWTTFTTQDGLVFNWVRSIFQDREGTLWFGTMQGVSRYDGQTWTTFTPEDGMSGGSVLSILQDREGMLWFGTNGGVSRYDGQTWATLTARDGLVDKQVQSIFQDQEGYLWFGTGSGGVSRYDGKEFVTFTTNDGLADNRVLSIFQDREGVFWFGTPGGVNRYDGQTWTTFTTKDGLAHNGVGPILQDREGHLWFGTGGGGVSRYDGQTFQTLTRQDGLASGVVNSILQDRAGMLWFGTSGGLTRYRSPAPSPPPVFVDAVVADRRYEKISDLSIPSSVKLTTFEFHGTSFKTRPEAMVYRYRLKGYDKDWKNTHARRVEYHDLPRGTYTFEVQAVDRDLVYSKSPATVTLRVHLPYERIGLLSALGVALALVAWQTARVVVRDRRLRQSNEDMRREMEERQRAEEERQRAEEERMQLDERLQQVRYLYRLREALGTARSSDEVFQRAGQALMEVLSPSPSAGVLIEHDGQEWRFGETENVECRMSNVEMENPNDPNSKFEVRNSKSGGARYERGLSWGGKQRGSLSLFCGVELSESQERTLLDETAGQIAGVLEAQELEMQLLHSARLVSLGQMAAGVAHELNQPLDVISTVAGDVSLRLAEDLDLSPKELKAMMGEVLGMVERMAGTVEHLRIFSRDKSGEPGVLFDVNEVVQSSLKLIGTQLKSHGVVLQLDLADGLPFVSGHPHQMEQVLLNLLRNACDALDEKTGYRESGTVDRPPLLSPRERGEDNSLPTRGEGRGGGRITDHESRGWEKEIWVRTRCEANGGVWVVVEVEDNGAGMDESVRARLFEPFFTTKPADRGTGLGLSISYAMVRDHGGQITCESRRGEGTMFRVTLPASEEA